MCSSDLVLFELTRGGSDSCKQDAGLKRGIMERHALLFLFQMNQRLSYDYDGRQMTIVVYENKKEIERLIYKYNQVSA